jgi:hypothetical protein
MLSNGVEKMDVHGMNKLVLVLLEMDIWKYWNGVVTMDAIGMKVLVPLLPKMSFSAGHSVSTMDADMPPSVITGCNENSRIF